MFALILLEVWFYGNGTYQKVSLRQPNLTDLQYLRDGLQDKCCMSELKVLGRAKRLSPSRLVQTSLIKLYGRFTRYINI